MPRESAIQSAILLAASRAGGTIFRQNVGMGWTGKATRDSKTGDVLIRQGRPLHAGLIKGSSDLIGWMPVTITPDMVGATIAVFTAIEVKQPGGRSTPEQRTFIRNLQSAGGRAGVARSVDEALAILQGTDDAT